MLSKEAIKSLPKVLLHDHLDGGLRPQTIIDIANEIGYKNLPAQSAEELANWFRDAANSGSLVKYLETFSHTVAVMQRKQDLVRVAKECVLDLASDGVVYAEVRYAPELHLENGLSLNEVIEAVNQGFAEGMAEAKTIKAQALLCGMRHMNMSDEIASLTTKYLGKGVAGFDIAGPELGFPPTNQKSAFEQLLKDKTPFTIHAGEADGPESIWLAIHDCGAQRIGHGVRIIEDGDGKIAKKVREEKIALEVCPTSNLQTGIAKTYAEHPINELLKSGFIVTLNTDNRLMGSTSMSNEMLQMVKSFGWGKDQLEIVTLNGAESAFISDQEKRELIESIIKPGFAAL